MRFGYLYLEKSDGTIVAKESDSVVPEDVLKEIWRWKTDGLTDDDVISRLRCRTVPSGYSFCPWMKGDTHVHVHVPL